MKNHLIEAIVLAIGLIIMGFCIESGLENGLEKKRTVSVKGLAEREVKANKVTWPLAYQELGNDLQELYSRVNKNNAVIVKFLTSNGVNANDITQNAPVVTDFNANQYVENRSGYRYNVKSCVTVSSSDVDKVRKLILRQSELMSMGIAISTGNYEDNVTYEYTDLNKIKPQMIEEATKNARQSAEKFASDSDSKLGKISQASQGQFSIEDRDANTPYMKKVRVVSSIEYYLKD